MAKYLNTLQEYLDFFKEKGVAVQITLDIGEKPTVHAFERDNFMNLAKTEGETLVEALENMKHKLFGKEE